MIITRKYYQHPNNPYRDNNKDITIKDAVLSTIDGGFIDCNPVNFAISECVTELGYLPLSVLSVGCGQFQQNPNETVSNAQLSVRAAIEEELALIILECDEIMMALIILELIQNCKQ